MIHTASHACLLACEFELYKFIFFRNDSDVYFFLNELISDPKNPSITPIQGPIFIKNGSVPVVPLLSYPTMNNGTFIRIPVSNAN